MNITNPTAYKEIANELVIHFPRLAVEAEDHASQALRQHEQRVLLCRLNTKTHIHTKPAVHHGGRGQPEVNQKAQKSICMSG